YAGWVSGWGASPLRPGRAGEGDPSPLLRVLPPAAAARPTTALTSTERAGMPYAHLESNVHLATCTWQRALGNVHLATCTWRHGGEHVRHRAGAKYARCVLLHR